MKMTENWLLGMLEERWDSHWIMFLNTTTYDRIYYIYRASKSFVSITREY